MIFLAVFFVNESKVRLFCKPTQCFAKVQTYTRGAKVLQHPVKNGGFLRANGLIFEIYITKLTQCRVFFPLNLGSKIFVIHSTSNQNKLFNSIENYTRKIDESVEGVTLNV